MEQIIITKKDGSEVPIQSRKTTTNITNAKQSIDLLSKDVVNITVESPFKQNYDIGDSITVFGRAYKLNRLPIAKKNGANSFVYELEFEGVQYDLLRATYDLTIETTNNQLQDFQANSLTGSLSIFATVWLANANRVFPGEWALGSIPETDEDRTLTFSEESNCLSVLSDFCKEFDTEYKIEQINGVNTLHFGKVGSTHANTFEYGKGKGIYQLTRQNVSSSNLVTRLKVFGSSRNITSKYRAHRLCMPGKTRSQSYIEDATLLDKYGIFEATKNFDDIYPTRTGKVTALGGDVLTFSDNTMFDLSEKEADGKTTKYLLPGVAAKVHFNSGNLAGYQFDVSEYDHETKTFILNKQTDDRGLEFPNSTSQAFQFAVGDEYKLLDIALPQSYVDAAEARLEAKGLEYYEQNSQPKVKYSLSIDQFALEKQVGAGTIANIFMVGDYIKVKDSDIGVDKSIRVIGFVRNVLKPYEYALTISDSITESIVNRVISESIEVGKIITQNNLRDPARARQNWRSAQEVLNMVFDPEGDYFTDKIKPESIETIALSVGAKSMQFGLTNTVFQPNYNGNKNLINVQGGVLSHYTINENAVRSWNLSSGETVFTTENAYYIYAKCERVGSAGTIIFSPEQIKTESDANYYHFLIGVVNSVGPQFNVRSIALSYGFSMVNGRYITTGRISSHDGKTYFDLDNNEIKGKITFLSSTGDSVEMGDYAENIQTDIANAKTEAAEAAQTIAEAEAALAEARAVEDAGGLVTAEQERAIADAEAKLQEAIDHANAIDTALQEAIDTVDAKANEKKRVFIETPYTPYDIGDLWVDGEVLKRSLTEKMTGSFNPNDWVLAVKYDNTKTVIDGGVVTSGTIQLAGSEQSVLAGITGEGVSNESVRIWAGASKENRGTAPYRVLQDGSIIGTKGMIGGLTIEMNRLLSQGGRVEINGNDSIIALRDENGNIKTIIKPTDIPAISDYFKPGENFSGAFGFLNGTIVSTSSSADLEITDTSQSEYDLNIPSFSVENIAYAGSTNNPSVAVYSYVTVDLTRNGLTVERLKESEVTAYWDEYPGPYEAKESFTISVRKVVAGGGNWGIKITHHYRESIEGNGNGEGSCFVSGAGIATASKIVNRSEIGNNGMVIATSNQYYTYMVDDLYEVRRGLIGFRVTSTGIQKSTNMNMTTPTWNNI